MSESAPPPAPHDWFRPRLAALVASASRAGFALDVSVAVITDIINGPSFNLTPLDTDEAWNQDIGEPVDLSADLTGASDVPVEGPLQGELSHFTPHVGHSAI